ncbi:MAG: hypothetical protein RIE53_04325 [Rhodothermales bacterium]
MKRFIPFLFLLCFAPQLQAQDLTSARAVIEANIEATGGQAAWESVSDIHQKANVSIDMMMGLIKLSLESHATMDGHIYAEIKFVEGPDGIPAEAIEQTVYITPDGGWIKTAQGQQDLNDMPEAAQASIRNQFLAKPELTYVTYPDSSLTLVGTRELDGGTTAYEVVVNVLGQDNTLFYDTTTLYQVGVETSNQMGTFVMTSTDHRDVGDGLVFAFKQSGDMGQAGTQTVELETLEVNTGLTSRDIRVMSQPKTSIE